MRMIFSFKCPDDHITDKLVQSDVRKIECPVCSKEAVKRVTGCNFHMDPFNPTHRRAWDKWADDKTKQHMGIK